ncbi:Signal transduction histidine kinase [Lachnospiraceae bacterium NE2001]|nr:Signal transduction histidine kinase [Lachnospiraceae bacterium NE2001]
MKSLRAKMTILIVLVVLGSSVLLSFISYQRAKSSLILQMEDNYGVAAQKYALELTSWVNTNATILDTMAAEIAVSDISTQGYDAFHNYLKHSNELLNKYGYVYDIYFTYPDNYMVCASDFVADGTVDFVHEREWYTTSALTGELFFSTPYLDSDTKKSIVTISKAVYKDDELLGVLAADIFVDVLVEMVNEADVADNSYAFLIDQNMRMIVHPDEDYAYEDTPLEVMGIPDAPYGPVIDAINTGSDEMVFIDDYDGVKRGIVYSQMTNTGWYVGIATSTSVLERDVAAMMRGFVVAAIVAIVIGGFMAIFLARVLGKLSEQEQQYKQQVLELEKQAADEANEAKSRFLADMSHEIRTPINAILGMNEMILRESNNKDIRDYSENIQQSGHNLLQLINGILDFSKIEDGKMEIVPVNYHVGSQVTYLYNSISERAKAKNLELIFDIDRNLPTELYGDDTRINQVVMNLLTNAVKYTDTGSVTLKMEERQRRDNETGRDVCIYFEVKDTGIGIKDSDMEKLFESFERLDVVRNRNIEGTGLGMTITRKLLGLMGSELKVESQYGVGSIFSFELWQRIENDEPLGDYQKESSADGKTERYKESFRAPDAHILVVDDTNMNLLVIVNLLKKTGIKIDTALNGPDSITLAGKNNYDIILMDQRMPGMDGTEAMQEIRKIDSEKARKTPIICLTADVIRGARERYLELGFDDYLTKPVEGAELESMILKYLPDERLRRNESNDGFISIDTEEDWIEALNAAGLDTETGIGYCGDDKELYRVVVDSFAEEEEEKTENIKKFYDAKDWKNYCIYVHSLKSGAKTIGAMELSEVAAALEAASRSEDTETIERETDRALSMYSELAELIRQS